MKKILSILVISIFILSGSTAIAIDKIKNEYISQNPSQYEYDMIIITPSEFSTIIQPLIDHKNSHEIKTILKTTEDIYLEYEGRDKPEQIKFFIKYAKEEWNIDFVLLIGGINENGEDWYVPVRHVELNDGTGRFKKHISDLYYADLYKEYGEFDDWDQNGDNIIAQWPKDKFDLNPDIYIGRLPCRNTNDVSSVVEKIISYENNVYGQSWFNKMVVIGGDTFPDYPGYEGEITCDYAADFMYGFELIKLYTSTETLTGSTEIINAINNGCGFLFTRAKGGTDRIRVNTPDGIELIALNNNDVSELNNKDKYSIMILGECQHGQFGLAKKKIKNIQHNSFNILKRIISRINDLIQKFNKKEKNNPGNNGNKECIAEKLVYKKDGGAIAVLTNTNICFAAIGDINSNDIPDDVEMYGGQLAVEVFRIFNEEGIDILGEIHGKTVENYVSTHPVKINNIHCKSVQEWILIGDPSLKIGGYP